MGLRDDIITVLLVVMSVSLVLGDIVPIYSNDIHHDFESADDKVFFDDGFGRPNAAAVSKKKIIVADVM